VTATAAEGLFQRASALGKEGKLRVAVACLRRAIALEPRSPLLYRALGVFLYRMAAFEEAAAQLRRSLEFEPGSAVTLQAYGSALHALGDAAGAVAAMDQALGIADDLRLRYDLAMVLLANGDFARGFAEHEHRRIQTSLKDAPPLWQGEDLAGRTILVHAEQGMGDTIQFARYIPLLAERGARVIFGVPPSLRGLFAGFPGTAGVTSVVEAASLADFHVPLMSLPHRFGTQLRSIPPAPYLTVPGTLKARLKRPPGTNIAAGIVWAGSAKYSSDRHRSLPVEEFLALAELPRVALHSLQVGPRSADLAAAGGDALVTDLSPQLTDFAITAAVLNEIDLVITVDTAVAHLAGAMGRPCWVLLPFSADWRWLRNREDSPWYPSLRLFRQTSPGDWPGVMQRVRNALEAWDPSGITPDDAG
jgi:tetratricopeptide (TPR) repeat protein